jgi:alcohol dehydrogenase class IV
VPWDAIHVFECPTRVFFGHGASLDAGNRLGELGVARALVVSDPGVRAAGIVDAVAKAIRSAGLGVAVYADTTPNPTTENVERAVAVWNEFGCDGIVGVGGGSSMDAAKATAIVAANGGAVADYAGQERIPGDLPPVVCIPTTSGTGSEVTFNAVITDEHRRVKLPYVSRKLAPKVALVDPELVQLAPPDVIAATGADALAHAIESYLNKGSDPLLDAINIAAIRLIGRYLRPAVHERDREAVAHMALASTMAGISFNMNANAIVHAASTPVTAKHNVPHGVANAVFMVPGLEFLLPACRERLGDIASALGASTAGLAAEEAGARGIQAVRELLTDVGLPRNLVDAGVDPLEVDIPTLIEDALRSRNIATNPRPVAAADLEQIYLAVLR